MFGLGQRFPFAGVRSRRRTHHGVEHRNRRPTNASDGLDRPHGLLLQDGKAIVSEAGRLTSYTVSSQGMFVEQQVLVSDVPVGNHQTNSVSAMPNGTLIWHSGSTCNVCDEDDQRNAALLWVNATSGEHGVLASGVRNSTARGSTGTGIFSPTTAGTGRETASRGSPHNFMIEGAAYGGWPDDEPETPVPEGTRTRRHVDPAHLDERIGRSPLHSPSRGSPRRKVHDVRHGVRIVEHPCFLKGQGNSAH